MSDWDSAAGWDGLSTEERMKKEKEREGEYKRARERFRESQAARAAIEVRTLGEWASVNAQCTMHNAQFPESGECGDEECRIHNAQSAELAREIELFPPFWCPGELAVLMGPSGVGKSRLAMQVATNAQSRTIGIPDSEDAEERTTPASGHPSDVHPARRCSGGDPGFVRRGAAEEDFDPLAEANGNMEDHQQDVGGSSHVLYIDLERTGRQYGERYSGGDGSLANVELGLLGDVATPEKYRGRRHKFLLAALNEKLALGHPVVILDNLTWLLRGDGWEVRSLMKGFRRWVNETGHSMLVLWHSSPVQSLELQAERFELADSVFALKTSTMGENIRYVKSLSNGRQWAVGSGQLAMTAFDLGRQVMVLRGDGRGFVPVGVSREIDHHHDYASDILAAKYDASRAKALLPPAEPAVVPKRVNFLGISD